MNCTYNCRYSSSDFYIRMILIDIISTNYENVSSIVTQEIYTNGALWQSSVADSPWTNTLNTATFTNGVVSFSLVTSNSVGLSYVANWSNYVSNVLPTFP